MLGFLVVGAAVYVVTAPGGSATEGRSWSSLIEMARRGVRGNRASTEVVRTETFEVGAATDELRLTIRARSLTITGEDREDIEATLKVWSNGFDDAEAERLARETSLERSGAGARMTLSLNYPEAGSQRANVTLKVPARLAVSVNRFGGELSVAGTAQAELVETSGDAVVKEVRGKVIASHRGGELTISDVADLKLTSRGAEVRLSRAAGDLVVTAQGGTITASELSGTLEIESGGAELEFDRLTGLGGQLRVNATGGSLRLHDVAAETRIEGRGTDVELTLAKPAPVGIYNEGQATIEVTPARGGYDVDARATNAGTIVVPEGTLTVSEDGEGQRASGSVGGGGPLLTLRTTRGEIVIRERAAAAAGAAEKR